MNKQLRLSDSIELRMMDRQDGQDTEQHRWDRTDRDRTDRESGRQEQDGTGQDRTDRERTEQDRIG